MESNLQLFQNLFYVFLGIAILGFLLTVLFFFLYRIPELFALVTGRTQKKTLERMRKRQSESSGSLRERASTGKELQASGVLAASTGLGTTKPITQELRQKQEAETGLSEGAEATSLLEKAPETSLLSGPKLETTVLSRSLKEQWGRVVKNEKSADEKHQTTALAPLTASLGDKEFRFEITEESMLIHSQELI